MLHRSILQYFWPALSDYRTVGLVSMFWGLLLSDGLRKVLLYIEYVAIGDRIILSTNFVKKNNKGSLLVLQMLAS